MVEVNIGRHGVILLVLLFAILAFEDVLVWINSGTLPAVEFFVGLLLVLGVVAFAIREANLHPPPRH
ncbi:hypothetical protein [Halorarius litoreus]|uniref:hypothetical protein n=1 Tax=Halorarius litoreus TaxID=2962676 RepID=UPI0020CFC01D|nr:hypothetical protein [Halorarius litoreus]